MAREQTGLEQRHGRRSRTRGMLREKNNEQLPLASGTEWYLKVSRGEVCGVSTHCHHRPNEGGYPAVWWYPVVGERTSATVTSTIVVRRARAVVRCHDYIWFCTHRVVSEHRSATRTVLSKIYWTIARAWPISTRDV